MFALPWRWGWSLVAVLVCSALLIGLGGSDQLRAQEAEGTPLAEPAEQPIEQPIEQIDSTSPGLTIARQAADALDAYRDVPFVPGELLVGFYGNEVQALQRALPEVSAAAIQSPLDLRGLNGLDGDGGVAGYVLQVPVGQEWAILEQLQQDPAVAFVEPNWLVRAAEERVIAADDDLAIDEAQAAPETPFAVNDPLYVEEQWYLQRINSSRAWALAHGDEGFGGGFIEIQVAVIDSGIDVNHPEFRGRLLDGYNYFNPLAPPDDDYGHGTHVAGLIGAVANNAAGIAGVAPKVRIDARKVLDSRGGGSIANVSAAIRDAADAGADIINLSLESPAPHTAMEAAVRYAATRGVLLIGAAGNFYPNPVSWPAAYDEVMAVAATSYRDTHASYSNAGPEVELAAPGGERNLPMISTWPGGVRCRDINAAPAQSSYCTSEGTSMAAAVVSGAAAMIKGLRPSLSAAAIRQLLRETALPLNQPANFVGSGRLDMHAALRQILPPEIKLSTTSFVEELEPGRAPYDVTLRLDNPSTTALDWQADLIRGERFVQLNNTISNTISGTIQYGDPIYLSLTISPTHLITGGHEAALRVDGLRSDGTKQTQYVDLSVLVSPPQNLQRYYMPIVLQGTLQAVPDTAYRWEIPADEEDRTVHGMTDDSNIGVALPFTYTLKEQSYTQARIYSDGFLRFSNTSAVADNLPNACLPNLQEPGQAIYGWWADLNPGGTGARVSSFQPASDRFVVEFDNVPAAASVAPAYRVSFQMVIYTNGNIRLNYERAPGITATAPRVTIGVEAHDGLFFNQVACTDNNSEIGYLPRSRQSLFFAAEGDIY